MIKVLSGVPVDKREAALAIVRSSAPFGGLVILDSKTGWVWKGQKFVSLETDPDTDFRIYQDEQKALTFLAQLNMEPDLRARRKMEGEAIMGCYLPDDDSFVEFRQQLEAVLA